MRFSAVRVRVPFGYRGVEVSYFRSSPPEFPDGLWALPIFTNLYVIYIQPFKVGLCHGIPVSPLLNIEALLYFPVFKKPSLSDLT